MLKLELDPWYVSAIDVKEYVWCPVIPWLGSNVGIEAEPTPSMLMGSEVCRELRVKVIELLELPRPYRFEVFLEDRKEGLVGIIDVIAGSKSYVIVEVKAYKRYNYEHFEKQLMFYAYITTKVLGPTKEAYLVMGSKVRRYTVSEYELRLISKLIRRLGT